MWMSGVDLFGCEICKGVVDVICCYVEIYGSCFFEEVCCVVDDVVCCGSMLFVVVDL